MQKTDSAHNKYALVEEVPGADEYIALRLSAGLSRKSMEAAQRGLPNSLYAVCIRDGNQLIGMGRIVGDGGLNYEIVDMAVHPDYQQQGLGYRIMEALMNYLRQAAPESSFVSLIADDHAPKLYQKFGFECTAPKSVGMALRF